MNDVTLITHVQQTLSNNCVSACLSMITGKTIDEVTAEFHQPYVDMQTEVSDYLDANGVTYQRLYAGERNIKPDTAYLAVVPSLNIPGALHQIVIETTTDGEQWWVYDPNEGREGKQSYAGDTIQAYILEYAIPREWVHRRGR